MPYVGKEQGEELPEPGEGCHKLLNSWQKLVLVEGDKANCKEMSEAGKGLSEVGEESKHACEESW